MNLTMENAFQLFIGKSISVNCLKGKETVTSFKILFHPVFPLNISLKVI